MEKGRSLLRWNVVLIAVVTVLFMMNSPVVLSVATQPEKAAERRADIIHIDSMKAFGKLERPGVTFLHQKHTSAIEKKGKSCAVCHLSAKNPALDMERLSTM